MNEIKLAIILSHPIQYYSPVFQLLAERISIKVFYSKPDKADFDMEFRQKIQWDIPLLEGCSYAFITKENYFQSIHEYQATQLLVYGWAHPLHFKIMRAFRQKIPVLFRGDSNLLGHSNALTRICRRLVLNWIYRHVDKAFYVGSANKAYFKRFGMKENQLFFAPHAVDNKRFSESSKLKQFQGAAIRAKLGISEEEVLILFAGKFNPNKNPALLLTAFKEIQHPGTSLLFVGSGKLEHKLKLMVRRDKLEKVHFLPFQNQSVMPAIYQACDLFCMPSLHETWGMGINEAMAAGKAILASDTVGCAEDLVRPSNGKIFKNNHIHDLKQKLKAMISSKAELQKQGIESAAIISDWNFNQQIESILHGIEQSNH